MLLAIDTGNSTVAFGLVDGDDIVSVFRAESRRGATPDEFLAFLNLLIGRAGIKPVDITGVVVSSVVAPLSPVISDAVKGITAIPPMFVSAKLKLPVTIKYSTPDTLGGDRLASACAAYERFGGPVIVVDFGTATTLTVVDGDGSLLGGMIAPGLLTGYEALIGRTSGLPLAALKAPDAAIGKSTVEGLRSGAVVGHAAMVDGLLERAVDELGEPAAVVATGGLSGLAVPGMRRKVHIEPNLTIKGLSAIYRLNLSR